MFQFQISNYDSPELDGETAKLFQQRLEAYSRRIVPWMWKITDNLNAYAAKGPGREARRKQYHFYGVLLFAMGIFALVPGLMEPRTPALIFSGSFAIISGFLEFWLVRRRKPPRVPISCQNEAKKLLSGRRAIDWSEITMKIQFDESGMMISYKDGQENKVDRTASDRENQEVVPYEKITGIFETENLWLLLYTAGVAENGLLLQKKDLTSGDAGQFLSYLSHKTGNKAILSA